jgi:rsbT co-antagonist protein RsbR
MAKTTNAGIGISEILAADRKTFLDEWIKDLRVSVGASGGSITETDLREQCSRFLDSFRAALDSASASDIQDPRWKEVRELLVEFSKSRAIQGFSPSETATFVFSFKRPLFRRLAGNEADAEALADQVWRLSELLDALGLHTIETYLKTREEIIRRGQEDMLELSTPVVKLWDGILALPLIGTLDSARTQIVMETLLEAIVTTNCKVAIIDITGVATVDTVVAQHLLKTVTAARLMGADCIISGIRPQIAQTIVHLGINLLDVTSKATLRDAFEVALERTGQHLSGGSDS